MSTTINDIAKLLKGDDKKGDTSFWGVVQSTITDGQGKVIGYNVSIDSSGQTGTVKCNKVVGATTGSQVLVTLRANGEAVVTAVKGGDKDALDALDKAGQIENHFWYDTNGAHVSADSTIGANTLNTLINSGGMAIRKGTSNLATFTDTRIELGNSDNMASVGLCGGAVGVSALGSGNWAIGSISSTAQLGLSANPDGDGGATIDLTSELMPLATPNVEIRAWNDNDSTTLKVTPTQVLVNGSPIGGGGGSLPTGTLTMWGGTTSNTPSGWLLCDGSAVSRSTYSALFAVIGTYYGSGNGSTTFNLPNFRQKFPMGADASSQGEYPIGGTGGSASVSLAEENLPSHNHSIGSHTHSIPSHSHGDTFSVSSGGGHSHYGYYKTIKSGTAGTNVTPLASAGDYTGSTSYAITPNGGTHSHTLTGGVSSGGSGTTGGGGGNTGSTGSGTAHENRPPYLCVNFIIKT